MADDQPSKIPRCPPGLKSGGRRLWRSIVERFELEGDERVLLLQACRIADRLDALDAVIAEGGILDDDGQQQQLPFGAPGPRGGGKPHPAVAEAGRQAVVLARLLAALRIPDDPATLPHTLPQRRGGVRGVYGLRAVE